ncbi:hypothetical protein ZIOFF_030894 [Zingiber officinale]|uniref:Uncharacterized protein n=1 Tax=Zingiber officinale TaxID=94328 RepID=A0A8J5GRZ1_ZINOF|nr:hypothetical protein ZIOFF_030894 [Zingiber officinale]
MELESNNETLPSHTMETFEYPLEGTESIKSSGNSHRKESLMVSDMLEEGRMDASSSQRKRRGGGDDRLPSKPRPASSSLPRGEKGPAASEEDVEEFFAILRRMRDASQSVAVGRGTAASARWSPSFEWEDFFGGGAEKVACEGGDGARAVTPAVDEEAKRPQGIDLNADPGPEAEGVAVPSPLGEYTALSVLPPAVS